MLIRVPLIILIGFFTNNAYAEANTTSEIISEDKNSTQLNVTSKESNDQQNSNLHDITTEATKIINLQLDSYESSHKKSLVNTRISDSVVDIPTESNLKKGNESDQGIDDKGKDSDLPDSNITSIVTTKSSKIETDDTINFRRLNSSTGSEIKYLNLNDTYNSQNGNTSDMEIKNERNNDLESSEPLSDPHPESNTEKSHVFRRSHTDNDYEPCDSEENHNDTKSKISRDADNHDTNTEVSKESIVNDGISEKETTKLSNPHQEQNTNKTQVFRRNHTDNIQEPYDIEENHNETKCKKSRDADNHNINTKASKESIVNDVNHGTNEKNTTKLSNPQQEQNTEKPQVFRRNYSDNVNEPCDNEENHNQKECKLSQGANNHITSTKALKESTVTDTKNDTNEKDTTKHDETTPIDQSNDSNKTEIDSKEAIEHHNNAHTVNAVFTRRNLNHNDSEIFNKTNTTTTDKPITIDQSTTTEQPKTTEQKNNNYDHGRRDDFSRRNLNHDNALGKKSTAKQAKPNDIVENDYSSNLAQRNVNQRNKKNDFTVNDIVQPTETAIYSENSETAMSRSGRPDGGYIAEPYHEFREPNLIIPPKVLNTCCQARPSPNNEIPNSFIIHPIYGKIPSLFNPLNVLGKSIDINPSRHNGDDYVHHYLTPNIKIIQRLNRKYGNREGLNVFPSHAIPNSDEYANHGNNYAYKDNHGIVFANKNNPLTNYEDPYTNYGTPLRGYDPLAGYAKYENFATIYGNLYTTAGIPHNNYDILRNSRNPSANYENNNAKYLDYDSSFFVRHERSSKRDTEIDDNVYPRAVSITKKDNYRQARHENINTNHGHPKSDYRHPLRNDDPHKNLEDLANSKYENLITRRVYPTVGKGNDNNTIHGRNLSNQHEVVPSDNDFRHHDPYLSSLEENDDNKFKIHPPHATTVEHVPFSHGIVSHNPYRKAGRTYPVKVVPFRKFFSL